LPPAQLYKRTKFVSLDEMDFSTGRRELDDIMDAEEERAVVDNRWWARVWNLYFPSLSPFPSPLLHRLTIVSPLSSQRHVSGGSARTKVGGLLWACSVIFFSFCRFPPFRLALFSLA
jgi:hypothetical protein